MKHDFVLEVLKDFGFMSWNSCVTGRIWTQMKDSVDKKLTQNAPLMLMYLLKYKNKVGLGPKMLNSSKGNHRTRGEHSVEGKTGGSTADTNHKGPDKGKRTKYKTWGEMTVKIKEELSLTLRQRPKQTSLTQKQDWMNKGSTKGN